MQYINAPNIILGIIYPLDPDNTINQVILILSITKCIYTNVDVWVVNPVLMVV